MNIPPPKTKWRPTLRMIIFVVLLSVLLLPLAGLLFFRLYENQLVRETEGELIVQGAVLAAVMAKQVEDHRTEDTPLGVIMPTLDEPKSENLFNPIFPKLDLAEDQILGSRPDSTPMSNSPNSVYATVGKAMQPIVMAAQKTTLAGYRVLDPFGTVIAGGDDINRSFAHLAEIQTALAGSYASVFRQHIPDQPVPLQSISRGTKVRVFVALPVVVENRVAGVIYLSRTPSNILKKLYNQRSKVAVSAVFIFLVTMIIGLIFARVITGPIRELTRRTREIGKGNRAALTPLNHHGSREIVDLSQGLLEMADKLFERTDYISNFATHVSHELKSPLTSIRGAVELMLDDGSPMTKAEREKFLTNILNDTGRLTMLVDRLRMLANADNPRVLGDVSIEVIAHQMQDQYPGIEFQFTGKLAANIAMAEENAMIVFSNLIDNANSHGATSMTINVEENNGTITLCFSDNGSGVSPGNANKIFELFFTTRREDGGTGMGLGIVRSMLAAHKGNIEFISSETGATFLIQIPAT